MLLSVYTRRCVSPLSLTCSLALVSQLPKSSHSTLCWVHQCFTCQDWNRQMQDRQSLYSTALGTSWQLKSPYRLSVSTYGRSQHITLLKRQAPFSVVSTVTWTEQGSLITRPDVTVTIKMNCKNPAGATRQTITWQRILHELLGGTERTSSLLRPGISIFSSLGRLTKDFMPTNFILIHNALPIKSMQSFIETLPPPLGGLPAALLVFMRLECQLRAWKSFYSK